MAGRIRAELATGYGLYWYGQHDVDWVAYYHVFHRVLGVRFATADAEQLQLRAMVSRSCGWWWPREGRCVIAERPLVITTETGGDRLRLHDEGGPAVVFPDGWSVHCWHGTRVPDWVVQNPTAELISAECNIEIRRCAIERLGWQNYIEQAGLRLLGQAPDPGNPGCQLRLYDDHPQSKNRLLLAVNGRSSAGGGCTCGPGTPSLSWHERSTRSCAAGCSTTGRSTAQHCIPSCGASTPTWCAGPGTASGFIRGVSQIARAPACVISTGLSLTAQVSSPVRSEECEMSIAIPSWFIRRTARRPNPVSPPSLVSRRPEPSALASE